MEVPLGGDGGVAGGGESVLGVDLGFEGSLQAVVEFGDGGEGVGGID